MNHGAQGVALHLHSGVPVLDLDGDWNEMVQGQLWQAVHALTRAGHFDLIVNLSRADRVPLYDPHWRLCIERLMGAVKAHYGKLNLVGTPQQVRESRMTSSSPGWQWALSEEEAVCRIKGVPLAIGSPVICGRIELE